MFISDLVIAQLQKQQTGGEDVPILEDTLNKVKDVALTTKKSILNSNAAAAAEDWFVTSSLMKLILQSLLVITCRAKSCERKSTIVIRL